MRSAKRQIIAMGGGGFLMEPENPLLDEYILKATGKVRPKVLFIPTAQGDSHDSIARFYAAFGRFDCKASILSVFRPFGQMSEFEKTALGSDLIYVSGGATKAMLAIWREYGIDVALRKAWETGVVLAGLSAGAICWFEQGHSRLPDGLSGLDCLGFLRGSFACHFDGEPDRRPSYIDQVKNGKLAPGYSADDGAALHFVGSKLHRVVTSRKAATASHFSVENGELRETRLPTVFLGEVRGRRPRKGRPLAG